MVDRDVVTDRIALVAQWYQIIDPFIPLGRDSEQISKSKAYLIVSHPCDDRNIFNLLGGSRTLRNGMKGKL